MTAKDAGRDREIPLLIYLPAAQQPAPVVLFSHGLGGSRNNNPYLMKHWSARGYVVVCLQHPGSDESVWKDKPLLRRMAEMRKAASLRNFVLRVQDVAAALDKLHDWNMKEDHPLARRLDMKHVGMSGHSFGAMTTQAVSGQTFFRGRYSYTDSRIRAAVMFSPSLPRQGDPVEAFAKVKIPWLLMTGTKDTAPIGNADAASRTKVYESLPNMKKYEVVLFNAEHSAFSDRALPGDREARNPNHHRAIQAITTAFWDVYLRGDEEAKAWLHGDGPKSILEGRDRWRWQER